ncbi:MAG: hypothetical protein AB8G95_16330 [Anaerolineae bacterium]
MNHIRGLAILLSRLILRIQTCKKYIRPDDCDIIRPDVRFTGLSGEKAVWNVYLQLLVELRSA